MASSSKPSAAILVGTEPADIIISRDGGVTWKNLYPCYIRAMWVDPEDPQHMIAGPADGVSRNGRIEESFDSGRTCNLASKGMEVPWPRHMVERFAQVGDNLFAILSTGELWLKPLRQVMWKHFSPEITQARAMAAAVEH